MGENEYSTLIKAIQQHKLVVIVDLPLTATDPNELSKQFIVEELRKKLSVEETYTFEQMVNLGLKKQGKEVFVSTLNRIIIQSSKTIGAYHSLLEDLAIKYIVEAHYSPLLRNACIDSQLIGTYTFFSRDDDFSFSEEGHIIVSMFGDTEYGKEKLVISQNDFNGFFANPGSISSALSSIFKSTLLFIDFDPNSDRFKSIYDFICQQNGKYPAEAFLLGTTKATELSYGENENLTIIRQDASRFLADVAQMLNSEKPFYSVDTMDNCVLPPLPYKYLQSYESDENAIFFGRDKEIKELTLKVRGARQISMLISMSGYGKTSLINAGLIPALEKTQDYDVFYVRSGSNPWESMIEGVFGQQPESFDLTSSALRSFSDKRIQLIIIDQFEECFINSSEKEIFEIDAKMEAFLKNFASVSLLISIRQDFYAYLSKFNFLKNATNASAYTLEPLTVENAIAAVKKPTEFEQYDFKFEDDLVEQIITDLSTNDIYIDPSQLQIVCDSLYRELLIRNDKIITAEIYNELGKADGILQNYIDQSLKNHSDKRQQLAKELLKCLVSSKNTKIAKSLDEISFEISSVSSETGATYHENEIHYMLTALVESRLVRTRSHEEDDRAYELTHEYIIRKINEWMDVETLKFKEVSELFRNEYTKWTKTRYQTIMPQSQYEDIWKYRYKYSFTQQEKSYILLCLISYPTYVNDEMRYWISQNRGNPSCDSDLTYAINNFKGRKRIFSAVILSIIHPENETFNKIYNLLADSINPHLTSVEDEIKSLGETIDSTFSRKMNDLLNRARTKDMVAITSQSAVKLGLAKKDVDKIIKDNEIEIMRPFFPTDIRTKSFTMYQMDIYAVTNKMYAEFNEAHHYNENQADFPVVGINYEQAAAYAHWWGKDMPDEDEWEYAARGKDFYHFPWGNDWNYDAEKSKDESEKLCNTSLTGTDGARSAKDYPGGISPFGCFNMAGNVWEWTKTPVSDDSDRLIVKGGSWSLLRIKPWTWYRYSYSKMSGQQNVGFRCVLRGKT